MQIKRRRQSQQEQSELRHHGIAGQVHHGPRGHRGKEMDTEQTQEEAVRLVTGNSYAKQGQRLKCESFGIKNTTMSSYESTQSTLFNSYVRHPL